MPQFQLKDGTLTARDYERVEFKYVCPCCGSHYTGSIDFPSGLIFNSEINLENTKCPVCHSPVVLPLGRYKAENGKLINLAEESSPESEKFSLQ